MGMKRKINLTLFALSFLILITAAIAFTIYSLEKSNGSTPQNDTSLECKYGEASAECGVGRIMPVHPITEENMLDVPLDLEMQRYIYDKCSENDVPFTLCIAMIECESGYEADVISRTDDYGLMQINSINHDWLCQNLKIDDFLDPHQNIDAGIYMISDYLKRYGNIHTALMCYNMGEYGAQCQWENGVYSTVYSERVVEAMHRLESTKG